MVSLLLMKSIQSLKYELRSGQVLGLGLGLGLGFKLGHHPRARGVVTAARY